MLKQYLQSIKTTPAIALSALMLVGAVTSAIASEEMGKVTGRVTYSQTSSSHRHIGASSSQTRALPSDAVMYVTLVDVTPRQDVSRSIIARQTIANPGQGEMPFELQYDPQQIQPDRIYAVQVRVMARGEVMYTNTQPYQVITKGHPQIANVVVTPAN